MKKINVKKEQCIGCGACVAIDPDHFDFDDEGRSTTKTNENMDSTNLTNAIESCPTSAIEIIEVEGTCEENNSCAENETCECSCENCDCDCEEACDCGCEDCNCENDETCDCECSCHCCNHTEENEEK